MPKKGELARESVKNTIIEAFKNTGNYVDFIDKKIYVTAKDGDNGEVLQFAITLTMPKVPIGTVVNNAVDAQSSNMSEIKSTELSSEDKEAVNKLKEMLGIS